MKLFVWANPYPVAYGSSMFFAVAETVEDARRIAKTAPGYAYGEFADAVHDRALSEDPIRVEELPCGEWHRWEE